MALTTKTISEEHIGDSYLLFDYDGEVVVGSQINERIDERFHIFMCISKSFSSFHNQCYNAS